MAEKKKKGAWPWVSSTGKSSLVDERESPRGVIHEVVGSHGDGNFRVRGETLDDIENRRDPAGNYAGSTGWDDD